MMGRGKNTPYAGETHKVNSRLFAKMKEAAVKKNADARRGKPLSPEHRKKAIAQLKRFWRKGWNGGWKGRKHRPETIEKMRKAATGKHHSEETRKKISMANKGRPSSLKGKHISEETRRKISIANKGKQLSAIARER